MRMRSWKQYSTLEKEKTIFTVVVLVIALCLVALYLLDITGNLTPPAWPHETEHPIANAVVNWQQTFFPGAWKQ